MAVLRRLKLYQHAAPHKHAGQYNTQDTAIAVVKLRVEQREENDGMGSS